MTNDDPVDVSISELQAKVILLEAKSVADDAEKVELATQLANALDLIETATKGKLIAELVDKTRIPLSDLVTMDSERLLQIRDDQKLFKTDRELAEGIGMNDDDGKFVPATPKYGRYKGSN